jgi:hypothetical protein
MHKDGSAKIKTVEGSDIGLESGSDLSTQVPTHSEVLIKNEGAATAGNVVMRLRKNKIITHVPAQVPEVTSPSDERIKQNIEEVDTDELLQRLQGIAIKSYQYTEAWRAVRGIDDTRVRGVIAQELRKVFPEYVNVLPIDYPEAEFSLDDFHEVNKIRVVIDSLAALQAKHKRFTALPQGEASTSDVDINTADGFAMKDSTLANSGRLELRTGTTISGNSGSIAITSDKSAGGSSGSVSVVVGSGDSGSGGSIRMTAGAAAGAAQVGGHAHIKSGGSSSSSGDILAVSTDGEHTSGGITIATGASTASSGTMHLHAGAGADEGGEAALRTCDVAIGRIEVRLGAGGGFG